MSHYFVAVCMIVALFVSSEPACAEGPGKPPAPRIGKKIIYPASRGEVVFDHDMHVMELDDGSCTPCHRTTPPLPNESLTHMDARIAHYFCKGCHRDKGRGPTECHGCHKTRMK